MKRRAHALAPWAGFGAASEPAGFAAPEAIYVSFRGAGGAVSPPGMPSTTGW